MEDTRLSGIGDIAHDRLRGRIQGRRAAGRTLLLLGVILATGAASAGLPQDEELPWGLKQQILFPIKEWVGRLKDSKNAAGLPNKRGTYSRTPRRVDESTYEVTVHVDTAGDTQQLTERYLLTVRKAGRDWKVGDARVVDTYSGTYRPSGIGCWAFGKFSFDREGLKLSASNGTVCETYLEGKTAAFTIHGGGMSHVYEPPTHAGLIQTASVAPAIHKLMENEHSKELAFPPAGFLFQCDAQTCEQLLAGTFTGLERPALDKRSVFPFTDPAVPSWFRPLADRTVKERKADAFAHFAVPDRPGHRYYNAFVVREFEPLEWGSVENALPGSGVVLSYDNWEIWEVLFQVLPRRLDIPSQLVGPIYGYFTEETTRSAQPYDLERREDLASRWYQVDSVKGTVGLALEDPEMIDGDVEFGLTLKQAVRELPFSMASPNEEYPVGKRKSGSLFVNAVQLDGKELTWVRTGRGSGMVILPTEMPANTRIELRMNYATQGMKKHTDSYSYVERFGWMPFVTFGDIIEEWDLIFRSPSQYQILGIGGKVSEKIEDGVLVSHWRADQPVNFPSVVVGKYRADTPGPDFRLPKKKGGRPIPVIVHVDEASFAQWGIPPDALRPIAEQAANALALYAEITGLDYPYDELNLVNDAEGLFLYGQSPGSLIYLGSAVFRGPGFLASLPGFRDPTRITRFLRSVTAHEVAHQWWGQQIVNFNLRNYWFVESLAEYFAALYLEMTYGWQDYQAQVDGWRREILDNDLKTSVQDASTLGGAGGSGAQHALLYAKGPYAFHILRETFRGEGPRGPAGADKRFFEFLRNLAQLLADKREIVTLDMQRAAEKALGGVDSAGQPYEMDLEWFFEQWIRGIGIPQYSLQYGIRQGESGNWVVEGSVKQRVVVGGKADYRILDGIYYRGRVPLTIKTKGREHTEALVIKGPVTTFQIKLEDKPVEIAFNANGEILAQGVWVNKSW